MLQFFSGFFVSVFIGSFVLWLVIEKYAWPQLTKKENTSSKPPGALSWLLGIIERILYTFAFIINAHEWVAVWLTLKVAVGWTRWQKGDRSSYNIFLIGSGLSILFGLLGAWIILGHIPIKVDN